MKHLSLALIILVGSQLLYSMELAKQHNDIAMLHYGLSVKKLQEDAFTIKLSQKIPYVDKVHNSHKKCSLVADFTKQMITNEQDFAYLLMTYNITTY